MYQLVLHLVVKVHDESYIAAFIDGSIAPSKMREIGLPWSETLVKRTLIGTGSAIMAARLALQYGVACMCNGGTHHAHRDRGSGKTLTLSHSPPSDNHVKARCRMILFLFILYQRIMIRDALHSSLNDLQPGYCTAPINQKCHSEIVLTHSNCLIGEGKRRNCYDHIIISDRNAFGYYSLWLSVGPRQDAPRLLCT